MSRPTKKPLKVLSADTPDPRPQAIALLASIKAALPKLKKLLRGCSSEFGYEDPVYRYYHQSWKVYHVQDSTTKIVAALQELAPDVQLNAWFLDIVRNGTGKTFTREDNERWQEVTRPILEAFFHARYFLEMVVRYGRFLERPPQILPSGWASVLYLYGMR